MEELFLRDKLFVMLLIVVIAFGLLLSSRVIIWCREHS